MSTPTINVNLRSCDCDGHIVSGGDAVHAPDCASAPVLIPYPIPRSVTLEVRLGKCDCVTPARRYVGEGFHTSTCPARPIRVSCSISGKTWEESEPTEAACDATQWQPAWSPANEALLSAVRERWALVKALVLDMTAGPDVVRADLRSLVQQRDAVFSALANMARAEQAEFREWLSLPDEVKRRCQTDPPDIEHERTPAVESLAAYVEHLIEQVGCCHESPTSYSA